MDTETPPNSSSGPLNYDKDTDITT